jgi:hypothetical protein
VPPHTLEQIRQAIQLPEYVGEYVALKRRGNDYTGLCPFHGEKTGSFTVHGPQGKHSNYWKCFGCQAGGNIYDFSMRYHGYGFREAVEHLADRAGISLDAKPVSRIANTASAEDKACAEWWWARRRQTALDAFYSAVNDDDEEFAEAMGRIVRAIDAMRPEERLTDFRRRVTDADRNTWREAVAEDAAFTDAWMSIAPYYDEAKDTSLDEIIPAGRCIITKIYTGEIICDRILTRRDIFERERGDLTEADILRMAERQV